MAKTLNFRKTSRSISNEEILPIATRDPCALMVSVGTILLPARLNLEATMAGLPLPLMIAIWLTGAIWVVGLAAYYFGFSSDLVWFVLFLGTGAGLLEWRGLRNGDDI
jgi:hypothetical protein